MHTVSELQSEFSLVESHVNGSQHLWTLIVASMGFYTKEPCTFAQSTYSSPTTDSTRQCKKQIIAKADPTRKIVPDHHLNMCHQRVRPQQAFTTSQA